MKAIIVTGGKKPSKGLLLKYMNEGDFIIGVDSGCNCLYEYDIEPDIIMGDFDSADEKVIKYLKEKNIKKVSFNKDKDYSDTQLGYEKAKELGFKEIIFFGHSLSKADYGYFRKILDSYIDNPEVHFTFVYNVYEGTTTDKKRRELIHSISSLFGEYSINKQSNTDIFRDLIQKNRIKIVEL